MPLLIENMGLPPQSEPHWVNRVLSETGAGLLLDLAHARVAANLLGMEDRAYLSQLPLEKAAEIHLSGSRIRFGRRIDAHESLHPEDYDLLAWVLERTQAQVVTLEYIRQVDPLAEQLHHLRNMIARQPGC